MARVDTRRNAAPTCPPSELQNPRYFETYRSLRQGVNLGNYVRIRHRKRRIFASSPAQCSYDLASKTDAILSDVASSRIPEAIPLFSRPWLGTTTRRGGAAT